MSITLYGISNCDTVRKAQRWLDAANVDYQFHDFRKDGLHAEIIKRWLGTKDWDQVINRRSTSWRALTDDEKASMDSESAAAAAVSAPTLVKRPVLEGVDFLEFGFNEARYTALLK